MSGTDNDVETSSGLKLPRFHGKRGEDYGLWRHRLRAACRIKGVWDVVNGTPDSSAATADSTTPSDTAPQTMAKREKASGIIICALGDAPLRVVMEIDDDPARMLKLLDARYASNRTVSRIAVQTQLFRMSYHSQDMSTYIDQYTTLFSQLERMGKDAAVPESHKAPMLLASIDPNCALESTAAALRTKEVVELTWDYVATTLIDEYNAKQCMGSNSGSGRNGRNRRRKKKSASSGNTGQNQIHRDESDTSDIESTVRAFTVALRSMRSGTTTNKLHCDFCDKSGHTEDRCYINPDNPDNKLSQKARDRFTSSGHRKGGTGRGSGKKVELAGAAVQKTSVLPPKDNRSYADSGATGHFFHCEDLFVPGSLKACDETTVLLADQTSVQSTQCGDVILPFQNANIRLKNAFFVPGLGYNLVSTGRLADNGIESCFRRYDVILNMESSGFHIGCGNRDMENRLYMLPEPLSPPSSERAMVSSGTEKQSETQLWHQRLAHINVRDLQTVYQHADGVPKLTSSEEVCRACRLGKAHKLPFPGHFRRTSKVGELVHSDIMGKLEPSFPDRFRYVSTFLDDHSRYVLIGCIQRRNMLKTVFNQVSSRFQDIGGDNSSSGITFSGIKRLHSDGAKEYIALQNDLGGVGGDNSFSPPYTPELNGIAERVNRTMVEAALALLIQADLPRCLWPYALKHVIYVRNRVPHSTIGVTPYSVMTGAKPSLKHVRVFGCTAYVLRLPRGTKFESRALEGVYLETLEHGIYRVLITEDDGIPRVVESRHVTFDESKFLGCPQLVQYWEDEISSDEDYSSDSASENSYASDSMDSSVSIDQFDDADVLEEDNGSSNTSSEHSDSSSDSEFSSHSSDSGGEHSNSGDEDLTEPDANRRYPSRERRAPPDWYVAVTSPHCERQCRPPWRSSCSGNLPWTPNSSPWIRRTHGFEMTIQGHNRSQLTQCSK